MRERMQWRRGKVSMKGFRNDPGGGGLGETALPGNATAGPCSESSKGMTYFNDMLGTTVGIWEGRASARPNSGRKYTAAALTAFGETIENESCHSPTPTHNSNSFYTGKPHYSLKVGGSPSNPTSAGETTYSIRIANIFEATHKIELEVEITIGYSVLLYDSSG